MLRFSVLLGFLTLAIAVPAQAEPTVSGTLDLAETGAAVGYDFAAAPLLEGPEASAAVGLAEPIRRSATRYAPVTLSRVTLPPGGSLCGGSGAAIADARALLAIDQIDLDVRKGRGKVWGIGPARVGDGPYGGGDYPAPGLLREPSSGCLVRAVASGADRFLGDFAAESLQREPVKLRFEDGAWRGTGSVVNEASDFGPATEARIAVALAGTPVELGAHCRVPSALTIPGTTVRTKRAARRLLRSAGFERVRFAGPRHGIVRSARGRYVVLTTSALLPCDTRVRVHRGAA
jgi:hypothetical protein